MSIRRTIPFPLFPALFPALYATWFITADPFDDDVDDDGDVDDDAPTEATKTWSQRNAEDAPATRRPRTPLTEHTKSAINALLRLLDTRPVASLPDVLTDPWQLPNILAGLPSPPLTTADLDGIAALRDHLEVAVLAGSALDAHDLLNDLALQHGVTPQLSGAGELTHQTAFADPTSAFAALFIPPVMELHALGWSDRVHECAAPRCWSLFLDVSKKGSQVFCSPTCGSRARARRLRGG